MEAYLAGAWTWFAAVAPWLMIGAFVGTIIGILPGTGGITALILLFPFTLVLSKQAAIALLLGAYCPAAAGGSIFAILLGVPDSSATTVVMLDGFAMTKNGRGAEAVGACLTAAVLGGAIGAAFLGVSIPIIKIVMMQLRTPEYLMFVLLAISVIPLLGAEGSDVTPFVILKGIVAGVFGVILSFVGSDLVSGSLRYTFDSIYLQDGIGITTVTLGMFGLSRVIEFTIEGEQQQKGIVKRVADGGQVGWIRGMLSGAFYALKSVRIVGVSSFIGLVLGFIPAAGPPTAAWIAYAQAKAISKQKEPFGEGNIDGVISSQTAQNACVGGDVIPTVGFGIPGSLAMAILMAGLLLVGLEVGPRMIQEESGLIWEMVWVITLGNFIGAIMSAYLAKYVAYLSSLKTSIFTSIMIMMMLSGAYVGKGAIEALLFCCLFGIVGYCMKRCRYSRPSLLIGFMLGGTAERDLALSLQTYGWSFLLRPVTLGLLLCVLAIFVYGFYNSSKQSKGHVTLNDKAPLELVFLLLVLGLSVILLIQTFDIPVGVTRTVPLTVLTLLIGLGAWLLTWVIILAIKRQWGKEQEIENIKMYKGISYIVVSTLLVWVLGMYAGIGLGLFFGNKLLWKENWRNSVGLGVMGVLIYWGLYKYVFTNVPVWLGIFG